MSGETRPGRTFPAAKPSDGQSIGREGAASCAVARNSNAGWAFPESAGHGPHDRLGQGNITRRESQSKGL